MLLYVFGAWAANKWSVSSLNRLQLKKVETKRKVDNNSKKKRGKEMCEKLP